jgi:hypothetical protein
MSFGRHHLRYLLAAAVAVAGLHAPLQLAAQGLFSKPPGRPIIESSASSDRGTNSMALDSSHADLRQFEDELKNSSFAPFSYSAASGYAPMPVLRSAPIPSKRAQEMLERRKNWMLLSPDETVTGPSAEDVFGVTAYGPDGERKKKTSPIEEFLFPGKSKDSDKEDQPGSSRSRKDRDRDPDSDPDASEDANLPESIRESQRSLRTALGVDPSDVSSASAQSSFSDFFGLAARQQTIEQESMQKARQDEWGSLFGVQQAPLRGLEPLKSVFNPPLSSSSPLPAPQLPDTVVAPPKTEASLPALSGLQPFKASSLVPDAPFKAYAPVTPALDYSKPAAPRLMPPPPTFTAPRRAF